MKQTVHLHTFRNAFEQCRPNNFSYEGLGILFDYLEEYEGSTGEELELDVIGFCCEWQESTLDEVIADYRLNDIIDGLADMDDDEKLDNVREYLADATSLAGETADGSFVFMSF